MSKKLAPQISVRHIYAIWRADAARRPPIRAAAQALQAAAVAVSQPPRRPHPSRNVR